MSNDLAAANPYSPDTCVKIGSGGVGERLKPVVLKTFACS